MSTVDEMTNTDARRCFTELLNLSKEFERDVYSVLTFKFFFHALKLIIGMQYS
jgi:hypothetical protein